MKKSKLMLLIAVVSAVTLLTSSIDPTPARSQGGAPLMDYPPNQDYGQQGDFIAKRATDAGRSAIISTIGPALLLLPESPGSSSAHVTLQTWDSSWDMSNPMNPQFVRYVNCLDGTCRNGQGIHAHATFTNFWNDEAYLWTNNQWQLGNSHRYDPVSGDTVPESPPGEITSGRLYAPFIISDLWSYGAPFANSQTLYYTLASGPDWRGAPIATWDHLGNTGVTGFFSFVGDLMIVSADQASTGMAIYSMNGWKSGIASGDFVPQLLSVYQPNLIEPDGSGVGLGGYWAEPYGSNKMIWAARTNASAGRAYPAMYVVDFSDPTNPALTCELYFDQDTTTLADGDNMTMPMYVNYQDQYAYVDEMKVDINACESAYQAGKAADPEYIISSTEMATIAYKFATHQNHCDGSQYFRPLGQIGIFGGYDRFGTEAIVTYSGPPFEEGSYQAGYIAHNFSSDQSLIGNANVQVGDTLSGRTITSVEIDERVNTQGMCFFVTSDEPDQTTPYVSGHRPLANQTNVATDTFISLHIPETLRTETLVNAFQLTRADTGAAVAFHQRLSHTGSITLRLTDDLADDVTYHVDVAGIQDYMGNIMAPYRFTFSTGDALSSEPTPTTVPPTDTPVPAPTDTPVVPPTDTPIIPPTDTPEILPTDTPEIPPTDTPEILPTDTPEIPPTNTPEILPTDTPDIPPTDTPEILPTETAVVQPTNTPDIPPTDTPAPTATPEPTGWIHCAVENENCSVPSTTVVRYGIDGAYAYLEEVTGTVWCKNQVFGDPAVGVTKSCEYWSGTPATDYAGTPYYPNQSSQISCLPESERDNVWVVNPDNGSITIIDTILEPGSQSIILNGQREFYANYRTPTSITRVGETYAVTYRDDDKVLFYEGETGNPLFSIDTGHGSQPVTSITDGATLFVSLFGSGEVIAIDPESRRIINRLAVGPMPRAMAMVGTRLLVTRFISQPTHGEVYDIDTNSVDSGASLSLTRTIQINKVLVNDDIDQGSGIPNFLASIVINRDGTEAFITAHKANIDRGTGPQSSGVALDDDNTVRPMMVRLDLVNHRDANVEPLSPAGTIDFDNAADPAGVTFLVDGETRMVTFQGNNVVTAYNEQQNSFTQFSSGFGPQEMCTTLRGLYVKNFTERSVSAIDVANYLASGNRNPHIATIQTVDDEKLTVQELEGLRQFYHSSRPQMGQEGYMSCASCHIDGGQDGQVWDLTSLGEGMRNTLSLNGTSGTRFGNLHWSSNFDEVQDFELQIEELNRGEGLIPGKTFNGESPLDQVMMGQSAELDALAAYVSSLGKESVKRSPYRTYTGELTEAAARGQQIFAAEGCTSCHAGQAFRDGRSHDVGTIKSASGNRLSGDLSTIRTPTLIELWETAPYFHDGSATTLNEVLDVGTHQRSFIDSEEADLIEFLLSIDRDLFIEDGVAYPDFE